MFWETILIPLCILGTLVRNGKSSELLCTYSWAANLTSDIRTGALPLTGLVSETEKPAVGFLRAQGIVEGGLPDGQGPNR